jgi:hypothetical protein
MIITANAIIYEDEIDPSITYRVGMKEIELYRELLAQGRIISGGFSDKDKGYFMYWDKDFPIARCYCPLMIMKISFPK